MIDIDCVLPDPVTDELDVYYTYSTGHTNSVEGGVLPLKDFLVKHPKQASAIASFDRAGAYDKDVVRTTVDPSERGDAYTVTYSNHSNLCWVDTFLEVAYTIETWKPTEVLDACGDEVLKDLLEGCFAAQEAVCINSNNSEKESRKRLNETRDLAAKEICRLTTTPFGEVGSVSVAWAEVRVCPFLVPDHTGMVDSRFR